MCFKPLYSREKPFVSVLCELSLEPTKPTRRSQQRSTNNNNLSRPLKQAFSGVKSYDNLHHHLSHPQAKSLPWGPSSRWGRRSGSSHCNHHTPR